MLRFLALLFGLLIATSCGDSSMPTADSGSSTECRRACDDGVFCNGAESCDPASENADIDGCVAGAPPCAAGECDESTEMCTVDDCLDADGDGAADARCGGTDCDDSDDRRYPGNTEVCDPEHLDEDCDPSTLGDDEDGDGFVDSDCCNDIGGRITCGDDCDDSLEGVNPSAVDGCGGGDEDCDGDVDEEPDSTYYRDEDGDTYGSPHDTLEACSLPPGYAARADDCVDDPVANPLASSINPGEQEQCNGRDDDCDGEIDNQPDLDGDGEPDPCLCTVLGETEACGDMTFAGTGVCRLGTRLCQANGEWAECIGAVSPIQEVCDSAQTDEDCDGQVNESLEIICYRDIDRDGYAALGAESRSMCTCPEQWTSAQPTADTDDCDDSNNTVNPGVAIDGCNSVDDDCDDDTDEDGVVIHYRDFDGDGYGCSDSTCDCGGGCSLPATMSFCPGAAPAGWARAGEDCVDDMSRSESALINRGRSSDACDGLDNNCDGMVDPGCACSEGDTQPCGSDVGLCTPSTVACDDGQWPVGVCPGSTGPTADIVCDGLDQDCDGTADNGPGLNCGFGQASQMENRMCESGPLQNYDNYFLHTLHERDCNDCRWTSWRPAVDIEPECDGWFGDCDGKIDENFDPSDGPCRQPVYFHATTSAGTTRLLYDLRSGIAGWTVGSDCLETHEGGCYQFSTYANPTPGMVPLLRCRKNTAPAQYAVSTESCPSGWSQSTLLGYVHGLITAAFLLSYPEFPYEDLSPLMAVTDGQEMFVTVRPERIIHTRDTTGAYVDLDHPSSPFRTWGNHYCDAQVAYQDELIDVCIIGYAFRLH